MIPSEVFAKGINFAKGEVFAMVHALLGTIGHFLFVFAAPCPVSIGKVSAVPTILFHALLLSLMPAHCSAIARAIPGYVLLLSIALSGDGGR